MPNADLHLFVNNNMLTTEGSCSNKTACKFICLDVHLGHSRCINDCADYTGG